MSSTTVAPPSADGQHVSASQAAMWADADLPPDTMKAIDRHCETCADCSRLIADAVNARTS